MDALVAPPITSVENFYRPCNKPVATCRNRVCPSSSKVNLKSHVAPAKVSDRWGLRAFGPSYWHSTFAAHVAMSMSGFVRAS